MAVLREILQCQTTKIATQILHLLWQLLLCNFSVVLYYCYGIIQQAAQ